MASIREVWHEDGSRATRLGACPVREAPRRDGDALGAFANVDKARELLGWSARSTLHDGVDSAFRWAAKRQEILGYP